MAKPARRPISQAGAEFYLGDEKGGGKPVSPIASKPASQRKVKVSYHLSPDVLAELEAFWFEVRRESGAKITRQEILERALRQALAKPDELRAAFGLVEASAE